MLDSDEEHWEVGADFIAGGLARHEKILYYDADQSITGVFRRLREDNVDVSRAVRSGQLEVFPGTTTRGLWEISPAEVVGMFGHYLGDAVEAGYAGLRVTDEPAEAVHRPAGYPLAAYDAAIDAAVHGQPASVLCQYVRPDWSPEELDELCAMHPVRLDTSAVYDDGLLRVTRCGDSETRLAGEIDYSNRHLVRDIIDRELDSALRALRQTGEIRLHLESLRFADVTTVVALVQAAESFPQSHRLVLFGVQPRMRRILDRCGASLTAQLTVWDAEP